MERMGEEKEQAYDRGRQRAIAKITAEYSDQQTLEN